jgi:hypothetical protein
MKENYTQSIMEHIHLFLGWQKGKIFILPEEEVKRLLTLMHSI